MNVGWNIYLRYDKTIESMYTQEVIVTMVKFSTGGCTAINGALSNFFLFHIKYKDHTKAVLKLLKNQSEDNCLGFTLH